MAIDISGFGQSCPLSQQRAQYVREPMASTRLLKGSLGTAALHVTTRALGFATTLVLAALLGASGYGAYAWAIAVVAVLRVPLKLGRDRLLVREVAAHTARSQPGLVRGVIGDSARAVLVGSVGFALAAEIALALAGASSPLLSALRVGLVVLPFATLMAAAQGALQGLHRVVASQLPDAMLRPLVFLAVMAAVAGAGNGEPTAEAALALQAIASAAALVATVRLLGRSLPASVRSAPPRRDTRAWNRSGLTLALNAGLAVLGQRIDLILVGALLGASSAGVYGLAVAAASVAALPFVALALPLSPLVAEFHARGEDARLARTITVSTRWTLGVTLIAAAALAAAGPLGLPLVGHAFAAGSGPLALLCLAAIVNSAFAANGLVLLMAGLERLAAMATAAGALSCALLAALLIPATGLRGAAVAVVASTLVSNTLASYFTWTRLGLDTSFLGRSAPVRFAPPQPPRIVQSKSI
jgi:O-antigen/teichoic acid export membrane protein